MTRNKPSRAKALKDITQFDLNLSDIDIAWLSGLLEGEGSFGIDERAQTWFEESTAPPATFIKLSMTDQDVVDKFGKMVQKTPFQAGTLTTGGKTEHIVHIGDRETCYYLLTRILFHLGNRRRNRVQEQLDRLNDWIEWYNAGGWVESARKGGEASALVRLNETSPRVLPSLRGKPLTENTKKKLSKANTRPNKWLGDTVEHISTGNVYESQSSAAWFYSKENNVPVDRARIKIKRDINGIVKDPRLILWRRIKEGQYDPSRLITESDQDYFESSPIWSKT